MGWVAQVVTYAVARGRQQLIKLITHKVVMDLASRGSRCDGFGESRGSSIRCGFTQDSDFNSRPGWLR